MTDLPTLDELLEKAKTFREELPAIKSQTSPEVIDEKILERKRFQANLKKFKACQRKMIAGFEADMRDRARQFQEQQDMAKKMIEEAKDYIRTIDTENAFLQPDIDELVGLKWDLIRERKSLNS